MAWSVSEPAGSTTLPNGAEFIRNNNTAIQTVLKAARLTGGTVIPYIFDTGGVVKSWFYLDTAPTNWTEVGSLGDTLLAVKGGTTYTTGGATAGTWTQPDHALTFAECAKHHHQFTYGSIGNSGSGGSFYAGSVQNQDTGLQIDDSTAGANHNHGTTYRPAARVGIICSLD